MKNKDYQNYDYLDIIVKTENEQEVVNAYSTFLWEKIQKKEDKQYNDVVHFSFRRPHKLPNKDRLQLLQVYYEFALNNLSDIKIKKHSKSKVRICNLSFFSVALLFGAGVFIYFLKSTLALILGGVFALGVIGAVIPLSFAIKKLYIKENNVYQIRKGQLEKEIQEVLLEVKSLTQNFDKAGKKNEKE